MVGQERPVILGVGGGGGAGGHDLVHYIVTDVYDPLVELTVK